MGASSNSGVADVQRIPYLLQVVFALYVLIAVQFVPETPRFLLAKGREQEAFQFMVDYHGNGDPTDELVLFEFEEMRTAIRLEQEAKSERWSTILRDRASRHRLGLAALMTFLTNVSDSARVGTDDSFPDRPSSTTTTL